MNFGARANKRYQRIDSDYVKKNKKPVKRKTPEEYEADAKERREKYRSEK